MSRITWLPDRANEALDELRAEIVGMVIHPGGGTEAYVRAFMEARGLPVEHVFVEGTSMRVLFCVDVYDGALWSTWDVGHDA